MNPVMHNNRALNHHHSTFERKSDGSIVEMRHPFPCDRCAAAPAHYCKDGELRCVTCHYESEVPK